MKVRCPDCGGIDTLIDELVGKKLRCSHCKCKFRAGDDIVIEAGIKLYYVQDDEKKGPFTEAEFDQLIASGDISPSTLVWCKGMTGWQSLAEIRGEATFVLAQEEVSAKVKVRCPDCGRSGLLSAEWVGKMVRCPQCTGKFLAKEDLGEEPAVKWYYAHGDEKKGPISAEVFDQLVASGEIASDTLVWSKGMADWQPLVAVVGEDTVLLAHDELPSATEISVPEASVPEASVSETSVSETPAPIALQADLPRDSGARVAARSGLTYAGGGKRLVAKFIDFIFMFALASLVEGLFRKLFPDAFAVAGDINSVYLATMFICFLLGMGYITWFVGKFGATPGKMVMSLKVVTPAGGRIDYAHAFGRYWAEFVVVFLTIMLGYLPIFLDSQRRGLHDRLSGTRVVTV